MLTSVDFSKGFNRVSHQHCLNSFALHGASTETLALLGTFLQDRVMTVRVGTCFSDPLPVPGGCPQGSLLSVLIFNISVDDIESPPRNPFHSSDSDEDGTPVRLLRVADPLNNELITDISLPASETPDSQESVSFENNGTISCLLYTSPSPRD